MRTLNDYFLAGGTGTISTANAFFSLPAVCPDGGRVFSVLINPHVVIDAQTVFSLFVNGVITSPLITFTLPNATADETTVEMLPSAEIFIALGATLSLRSNGAQVAATTADITWVVRR